MQSRAWLHPIQSRYYSLFPSKETGFRRCWFFFILLKGADSGEWNPCLNVAHSWMAPLSMITLIDSLPVYFLMWCAHFSLYFISPFSFNDQECSNDILCECVRARARANMISYVVYGQLKSSERIMSGNEFDVDEKGNCWINKWSAFSLFSLSIRWLAVPFSTRLKRWSIKPSSSVSQTGVYLSEEKEKGTRQRVNRPQCLLLGVRRSRLLHSFSRPTSLAVVYQSVSTCTNRQFSFNKRNKEIQKEFFSS